ncbi:MAG: prolyl oligopeptidase family serine peptidase [Planctomycetota bacterium]|nr:prolyl oligopeptidase family serine peptidase [Planctomycetota bacterium]
MLNHNRPGTLRRAVPFDVQAHDGLSIETAFLEFEDRFGRPVRLYAARCFPPEGAASGKLPLVVHQPGGGQTVFPSDLTFLARHGFAAASFDWQVGAFDHDPKRKSLWPEGVRNQGEGIERVEQAILPLAIQSCGVVIDWMTQHPKVDADRVGVVGISWGGYLTWAVNAHETRLKAAVPVFGCGGLWEFGRPLHTASKGAALAAWRSQWDALALASRQISPVCWISSTNDFFGYHASANALLDQLAVPHRRSCDPNNNHHVGPGESALAVAWLKHYLAGGLAVANEPALRDDLAINAHDTKDDPIVERQVWWTPVADVPDDYRCWLQSPLPDRSLVERAFGRVRYRSGITLDTPLRSFVADPRSLARSSAPAELPDTWPHALDGTCSHWGLRSTQLHRVDVNVAAAPGDPTRAQWEVARKDAGPVAVSFRGVADPRWNRGPIAAVEIHFDWQGATATALNISGEFVLPDGRRGTGTQAVTAEPGAGKACVAVRLEELKNRPAGATWADLKKIIVTGQITGNRFIMGPMVRRRG